MKRSLWATAILFALCFAITSVGNWLSAQDKLALRIPLGLPSMKYPPGIGAPGAGEIELGKQLFFDTRLSQDRTVSCASCHDPAKGWSNNERFATGIAGKTGGRSAPTIINAAYFSSQFWDGRADWLEGQAVGPIQNPIEMAMTLPDVILRLKAIPGYKKQFDALYKDGVTEKNIARAISAFERTILSGNAPFDRFKAGDKKAMSEPAVRGMEIFFNQGHCSACHAGPNFSNGGFHNIGIGMNVKDFDKGRAVVSKLEGDTGAFKTPTLREIARTAPYMHDGSLKTLEEVVEYYDRGGTKNEWLDEEIYPLKLTKQQKADLVVFMREGLSSPNYPMVTPPSLPPDVVKSK